MIHGVVLGGLGNQLFKIFATIAYSIEFKQPFVFFYSKTVNGRRTYWDDFLIKLKKYTVVQNNTVTDFCSTLKKYPAQLQFASQNQEETLSDLMFRPPVLRTDGDVSYWDFVPLDFVEQIKINDFKKIGTCMHHYEELPPASPGENYSLQYYLQSYKYFKKHEESIYHLIGWNQQRELVKTKYSQYFLKQRVDDLYVVSIHFRLGDYKHVQYCHNLLPIEYYKNALKSVIENIIKEFAETECMESPNCRSLRSQINKFSEDVAQAKDEFTETECSKSIENETFPKIRILYFYEKEDEYIVNIIIDKLKIFTDNLALLYFDKLLFICSNSEYFSSSTVISTPENVPNSLQFVPKNESFDSELPLQTTIGSDAKMKNMFEFVAVDTNIPDWQQMLLMSCCNSNIIANSTFSWWSAYSNPNKNKIICFPAIWFGPNLSHNNINDMFPNNWFKIEW